MSFFSEWILIYITILTLIFAPATIAQYEIHSQSLNVHIESFGLKQAQIKNCVGVANCAISFINPTAIKDTILVFVSGGVLASAITDDGPNTWPAAGSWTQVGPNSNTKVYSIVNSTKSTTTITVHRTSGDDGVAIMDFPQSFNLTPAESILNSAGTGYGVSLASAHFVAGAVVVNPACGGNSANRGTFINQTAFNDGGATTGCLYTLTNNAGTDISVTSSGGGLYDAVAIDLVAFIPPQPPGPLDPMVVMTNGWPIIAFMAVCIMSIWFALTVRRFRERHNV